MPKPKTYTSALDRHVAARLRRRRKQLGMTAQQIADDAGLTQQHLSKIESASQRISASQLYHLARSLGQPLDGHPLFHGVAAEAPLPDRAPAFIKFMARMRRALILMPARMRISVLHLAEGAAEAGRVTTLEDDDGDPEDPTDDSALEPGGYAGQDRR